MYLPQSVPLARPHVAMWFGRSGKRYDFAVSRARPMWLGQPVVYVLVRYDGDRAVPLFVGRATAADPQLGGPGSDQIAAWERAMALGMTHLHLRFEACTDEHRAIEVEDLATAMRPPLNEPDGVTHAVPDEEPAVAELSVADVALATAPQLPAGAVRPEPLDGWLGRTSKFLVARYRQWRLRPSAADALSPAGHVTVRADAIVVAEADAVPAGIDQPPASLAVEPPAAPPAPAEAVSSSVADADAAETGNRVRQRLGLGSEDVVVLFAGELTWEGGADLAVEAMATVQADPVAVRLLLVGDGALRGELESRAWNGGFAHACRFMGDLPAEAFADVFAACDAVVIPARSAQSPILAEHTLSAGKPVLTTHQAQLGCVRHGDNGLVTYDNPGSLVWGLREIRALVARRRAPEALAA